jgi:hypothetical protein
MNKKHTLSFMNDQSNYKLYIHLNYLINNASYEVHFLFMKGTNSE